MASPETLPKILETLISHQARHSQEETVAEWAEVRSQEIQAKVKWIGLIVRTLFCTRSFSKNWDLAFNLQSSQFSIWTQMIQIDWIKVTALAINNSNISKKCHRCHGIIRTDNPVRKSRRTTTLTEWMRLITHKWWVSGETERVAMTMEQLGSYKSITSLKALIRRALESLVCQTPIQMGAYDKINNESI